LRQQKNLTLEQRCQVIKEKWPHIQKITRPTLANIYRRHKVGNYKPGYKFCLGRKMDEEKFVCKKQDFLKKLWGHMRQHKRIIYLDETSTMMWEQRSRIWMPRDQPIHMRLQRDRGRSRTVIGAICQEWPFMKFHVTDKTNSACFNTFLKYIIQELGSETRNSVIVLDNHKAHYNQIAKDLT